MYAEETGECFTVLLEIRHDGMDEPIRVNNSGADIIHGENTYVAFPFDISLPNDESNRSPRARLSIDNTDRTVAAEILSLPSTPYCDITVVRAAAPETIEMFCPDFRLSNITIDAGTISADLDVEDFTQEPFPAHQFAPALFPGLF